MDTAKPKPSIATDLGDDQYGQREMTEEEYADLIASGWTETTPGEQNASQVVEEEVTDVSVADSGGGAGADESPSGV